MKKPPAVFGPPALDPLVEAFTNKVVIFRFRGKDLSFRLSHALFSSFDIDEGTRLLLKTIAQRIDLSRVHAAADIGCGVGVIGASIRAAAPHCGVLLQDRDALAVAFARENWQANRLGDPTVDCGLGFWHLEDHSFDLVASNLPAKAGKPVLESFFRQALRCLAPGGTVAIVIVATLADLARSSIERLGCTIQHQEITRDYCALHFSGDTTEPTAVGREDLEPYIRARAGFAQAGTRYELSTVYSLPDFDTVGYGLSLSMELLADCAGGKRILVWNPGQGHLPVWLSTRQMRTREIAIASRDCLECEITRRNMAAIGRPLRAAVAVPAEASLPEAFAGTSYDLLCAAPHPVPRAPWHRGLLASSLVLLSPGGRLCVTATSTEIHRFLEQAEGLSVVASLKHAGFRAVMLARL